MKARNRLRKNSDFQRTRRAGHSSAQRSLVVQAARRDEPVVRVGISVGKRTGNAVVRNRVKRRIREAITPMIGTLPTGWDLVIIARAGSGESDYDTITRDLTIGLSRLGLLIRQTEEPSVVLRQQR